MKKHLIVFLGIGLFLVLAMACAAPQTSPSDGVGGAGTVPHTDDTQSLEGLKGEASFDRNFLIVFDDSRSMGDRKCGGKDLEAVEISPGKFDNRRIDVAKWANKKFVNEAVPPGVNLGFSPLNDKKHTVPLGKENREQILQAIDIMDINGGTPLNRALREATDLLVRQRNLQLGYGEYYIIAETDGEATDDGGSDARAGAEYALKNDVMIITRGFCLAQNHALSRYSISSRNTTNVEEFLQALQDTQAELKEYDSP